MTALDRPTTDRTIWAQADCVRYDDCDEQEAIRRYRREVADARIGIATRDPDGVRILAVLEENRRLREALQPFAALAPALASEEPDLPLTGYVDGIGELPVITVAHIRAAEALAGATDAISVRTRHTALRRALFPLFDHIGAHGLAAIRASPHLWQRCAALLSDVAEAYDPDEAILPSSVFAADESSHDSDTALAVPLLSERFRDSPDLVSAQLAIVNAYFNQWRKWGGPLHDDGHLPIDWLGILAKQYTCHVAEFAGEALAAWGTATPEFRRRAVEVGACALAIVAWCDRRGVQQEVSRA